MSLSSRAFKDIIEFIFATLYALFLNLSNRQPCRVVIYFHGINESETIGFGRQMAYLAERCLVVKPSKIKTAKANGRGNVVAITFDDALVSILENVMPILKKYALPAAICVPTGNLGRRPNWEVEQDYIGADEITISEEQIAKLDKKGYEILSHTVSHPRLTGLNEIKLKTELAESKRTLERIVGHSILGISYPYGAYDDNVCQATRDAGYKIGFSIEPCLVEPSSDNFQIGRFKILPEDGILKFRLKITGAYQAVKYLRTLKKKCLSLLRQ